MHDKLFLLCLCPNLQCPKRVEWTFNASTWFACLNLRYCWSAMVFPQCPSSFFFVNIPSRKSLAQLLPYAALHLFSSLASFTAIWELQLWCLVSWKRTANTILWVYQLRTFLLILIQTFQLPKLQAKRVQNARGLISCPRPCKSWCKVNMELSVRRTSF